MQNQDAKFALFLKRYLLIILLVVLTALFGIFGTNFLSLENVKVILTQSTYTLIACIGVALTIIVGGMDLSIGYLMSLCASVYGVLYIKNDVNAVLAIAITLVVGVVCGTLNGVLWTKLTVHPIIVTISTQTLFRGLSYVISNSETMVGVDKTMTYLGLGNLFGIPFCIIISVVLLVIAAFILSKTYFGRKLYATGGNAEVATLSGVKVSQIRIIAFALCGLCACLATFILMGRSTIATPTIGPGTETTCITACLLAGVALGGGRGNLFNMSLAVLVLTVLSNGMTSIKMDSYWQYVAKAIVLVFALAFDQYTKKKIEGSVGAIVAKKGENPPAKA